MMEETFVNLKNPTAFTSVHKVHRATGGKKNYIKKQLLKHDAYKLHHPAPKRFPRRRVYSPYPNFTWGLDLAEITKYSKSNYNKRYILVCIDFFDRHAWFEPLKTKNTDEVLNAFKNILDRSERKPQSIFHDRGNEFVSRVFKTYCAENNIKQYATFSSVKCSMCERLIRTLFQIISKYMTHHNTKRFIHKLKDFEYIYNNSYHRSIKTNPANVNDDNYWEVYQAQYGRIKKQFKPRLQIGDTVLKVKDKPVFTKGYSQTFDSEPYTVYKVNSTNPPTYLIKNDDGKQQRAYYEKELLLIS